MSTVLQRLNTPRGVANLRTWLIDSRLTPNMISLTGLIVCLAAAALLVPGWLLVAGITFLAGSGFDALDGPYARMAKKETLYGKFLDSVLDRIEETIFLLVLGVYLYQLHSEIGVTLTVASLGSSLLVSYLRAHGATIGVDCKKVGIAERHIRVPVLSGGIILAALLSSPTIVVWTLGVLTALCSITVLQRFLHVHKNVILRAAPLKEC